jgi:hypothetical protein
MARLQAAVTMADANMLTLVRENVMLCTAVCLQMDRGNFKHLSYLQGADGMIFFDSLHLLTVMCTFETECHRT